jgi:hypothetical protein
MTSTRATAEPGTDPNKLANQLATIFHESFEKPSYHYLGLICDEPLTYRGLNSNPGHFRGST